jgi:CheY-like chemotaxis protein
MSTTARSAVIVFDAAFDVMALNRAAHELLAGRPAIGRPLAECLASVARLAPRQDAPRTPRKPGVRLLRQHLRTGMSLMLMAGERAWRAELSELQATGPDARALGVMVLRDAGEASDYRDLSLERVDPAAALSHDLRTPLNAMVGWLHLLVASPDASSAGAARAIAGLRRAIAQQQRLIEERLDRAAGSPGDLGEETGKPAGSTLHGCHVLAVDDNPDLLGLLAEILAAEGARVVTAGSADQALKLYPAWASGGGERILVSDIAMPGRDGFALIREIRALEQRRRLPRLPAVALSAHGVPHVRRNAIRNGFDLFLDKPIDPPVLLRRLGALLDR